ncbi:putative lipoate-protein ligase A [Spathaspora sp. JA1]|nr:putative lipoate-protein ligase A [Spathaspora sp. JA1]
MLRILRPTITRRFLHNVPFQDDLTPADLDDFNLGDFQHYEPTPKPTSFDYYTTLSQPIIFNSKLTDPYLNLALEQHIYNQMPKPDEVTINTNRVLFYVNSPCVVIGKNQNPWKEVNLPLLNLLGIPLLRRYSGGGTVVHDFGNVNFSFMTTKEKFDRLKFSNTVVEAINSIPGLTKNVMVNDRGDIITTEGGFKVSGSAYKLSRGKSYHHGTMLLNSNLKVLSKLLSRDESKLGIVEALNVINSVKSKVTNLSIESRDFIEGVIKQVNQEYKLDPIQVVDITTDTELPGEIHDIANELRSWQWKFGKTPQFTHEFTHKHFKIKFHIDKQAAIEKFELITDNQELRDKFKYLEQYIKDNKLEYTGSNVAGYILDDGISDWIGECIDGTV